MRWFFILLPWVELFTLIQLGGEIGGLATLFYVFLTFVLGLTVIRLQGMEILTKLQAGQNGQIVVGQMLGDELVVGFAGLLLLIPGLITDMLALIVLIGPLRRRLMGLFRVSSPAQPFENARDRGSATIDGEFRRIDDE